MQLTGTNRSFDLIDPINPCSRRAKGAVRGQITQQNQLASRSMINPDHKVGPRARRKASRLRRPGDFCKVTRPDPIPNSAVKHLSPNGTMPQGLGE